LANVTAVAQAAIFSNCAKCGTGSIDDATAAPQGATLFKKAFTTA
jgi:hypothetical protein